MRLTLTFDYDINHDDEFVPVEVDVDYTPGYDTSRVRDPDHPQYSDTGEAMMEIIGGRYAKTGEPLPQRLYHEFLFDEMVCAEAARMA